jgi:chaperonin GroES
MPVVARARLRFGPAVADRAIHGIVRPNLAVLSACIRDGELPVKIPCITELKEKSMAAKKGLKLQPLGDRVVVQRDESEEKTAGGIVLPDTAKDKPARGKVVSIGNGRLMDDGTRSSLQVKVGDRVIFSSYAGETFKVEDEELLLMREDDILAVIED